LEELILNELNEYVVTTDGKDLIQDVAFEIAEVNTHIEMGKPCSREEIAAVLLYTSC